MYFAGLVAPIALGGRALVAHDQPVAAARWSADLVESCGQERRCSAVGPTARRRHEAARLTGEETEPVRAKPGGAVGFVRPIRQRPEQRFAERDLRQNSRRRRRLGAQGW